MSEEPAKKWRVLVEREPEKVLRRLPKNLIARLRAVMRGLATNPRPHGCIKLSGYENLYRLRVGDWRISYAIEDDRLIVLIIEIAPRGGAYRNM